jgi:hypothetical protein
MTGKTPQITDPVGAELKQILRHLKLGRMLDTLPERLALARPMNTPAARPSPHSCAPAPPGSTPACAWTPGTPTPPSATTGSCGTS